ncbi:MAG: ATP-binding cassette domain-containing protein [Gammaproteobacteria bacterium]
MQAFEEASAGVMPLMLLIFSFGVGARLHAEPEFAGALAGLMALANNRGLRRCLSQPKRIPLDVSLECLRGELLALVGPSRSGKSTILRCIAGPCRSDELA